MTESKNIAIATDHRGEEVTRQIINILEKSGYHVLVLSTDQPLISNADKPTTHEIKLAGSQDYPEEAYRLAQAIANQHAQSGILVSGSAIGMCITANKCPGIRAVIAYDEWVVRRSRAHHNCNILCIPADLISQTNLKIILDLWLNTPFEAGHHERRVNKIALVEQGKNPADHHVSF